MLGSAVVIEEHLYHHRLILGLQIIKCYPGELLSVIQANSAAVLAKCYPILCEVASEMAHVAIQLWRLTEQRNLQGVKS